METELLYEKKSGPWHVVYRVEIPWIFNFKYVINSEHKVFVNCSRTISGPWQDMLSLTDLSFMLLERECLEEKIE